MGFLNKLFGKEAEVAQSNEVKTTRPGISHSGARFIFSWIRNLAVGLG